MKLKTLLFWILTLAPLIGILLVLPHLPERIPAHYDFAGQVDRWGSRYEMLIMPLLTLGLCGGLWLFAGSSRAREQHAGAIPALRIVCIGVALAFNVITYVMARMALVGSETLVLDTLRPVSVAVCLIFALVGTVLPRIAQNGLAGIRTPWTLRSEENWRLTHRFGGRLWGAGGLVLAVACTLLASGEVSFWTMIIGMVILALAPIGRSYQLHRQGLG